MKRLMMAAGAAVALGAPGLAHAETSCADLAKASLPHAEITRATVEKAGQGEACRIAVTSRPTKDSDIRIEVWIPLGQAWNGKFVQLGNGGFAGQVPSGQLRAIAGRGYAAAATDDGTRPLRAPTRRGRSAIPRRSSTSAGGRSRRPPRSARRSSPSRRG